MTSLRTSLTFLTLRALRWTVTLLNAYLYYTTIHSESKLEKDVGLMSTPATYYAAVRLTLKPNDDL